MEVGGQSHAPAALPPGKTRYPLHRRLGEPQGRSGQVRKILPPAGFDLRTFQAVASRYTYYAIPAQRSSLTTATIHAESSELILHNGLQTTASEATFINNIRINQADMRIPLYYVVIQ
jgi:hypothetical protein